MSVFALGLLFGKVSDTLVADGTLDAANIVFGWREAHKQINAASSGLALRVVFEPGDGTETGDVALGDTSAPKYPGRNPRVLHQLDELATIYCKARDYSAPSDEAAQYEAARLLFDAVVRAIYNAAHGTYTISKARWIRPANDRIDGAEIRFLLTLQTPILDYPLQIIAPDGVSDDQVADAATPPFDPASIDISNFEGDSPGTADGTDTITGATP